MNREKERGLSRSKVITSTGKAKSSFCVGFGGGRHVDSPVSSIFVCVSINYLLSILHDSSTWHHFVD